MSKKIAIIFNIIGTLFFLAAGIITLVDDSKNISAYLYFITAALLCFSTIYFIRLYINEKKEKK